MEKFTIWHIRTEDAEHIVTYSLNKIKGRITFTLDGDEYTLPAGPLAVRTARREPFRIVSPNGEVEMAILAVDKKGVPTLIFRSQELPGEVKATGVVVEIGFKK